MENVGIFTAICGPLVYFPPFWLFLQEKSGNPALHSFQLSAT
jgi:hypothetical protein